MNQSTTIDNVDKAIEELQKYCVELYQKIDYAVLERDQLFLDIQFHMRDDFSGDHGCPHGADCLNKLRARVLNFEPGTAMITYGNEVQESRMATAKVAELQATQVKLSGWAKNDLTAVRAARGTAGYFVKQVTRVAEMFQCLMLQ